MRLRFQMQPVALLVSMLLAPQLLAAQPATIQSTTLGQTQKTAEISTEELRRILADGSTTVFDARPFMEFAVGHIPGAVNVSAKPGAISSCWNPGRNSA